MKKKKSDKTYIVIEGGFEYDEHWDIPSPHILHLTAEEIKKKYKGYELENMVIIDGEVMKGYGLTSLPKLK
jgi:hypothetical protein